MRRIKTYKKWSIWRLTAAEANDVGGRFAAFLPETDPGAMDEPQRQRQASRSARSGRGGSRRKETKMVNRRKVFVQQFSDLLRSGRRTGVERLELSDNGNLVTICFEGGGRREVNVEGDSEAALILDVIRRVLY